MNTFMQVKAVYNTGSYHSLHSRFPDACVINRRLSINEPLDGRVSLVCNENIRIRVAPVHAESLEYASEGGSP